MVKTRPKNTSRAATSMPASNASVPATATARARGQQQQERQQRARRSSTAFETIRSERARDQVGPGAHLARKRRETRVLLGRQEQRQHRPEGLDPQRVGEVLAAKVVAVHDLLDARREEHEAARASAARAGSSRRSAASSGRSRRQQQQEVQLEVGVVPGRRELGGDHGELSGGERRERAARQRRTRGVATQASVAMARRRCRRPRAAATWGWRAPSTRRRARGRRSARRCEASAARWRDRPRRGRRAGAVTSGPRGVAKSRCARQPRRGTRRRACRDPTSRGCCRRGSCSLLLAGVARRRPGLDVHRRDGRGAGLAYAHGYTVPLMDELGSYDDRRAVAGGVAAGDYDRDGWVDLFVVRGDIGPNLLFRNRGDGTFEEVGAAAGVALGGRCGSGRPSPTSTATAGSTCSCSASNGTPPRSSATAATARSRTSPRASGLDAHARDAVLGGLRRLRSRRRPRPGR